MNTALNGNEREVTYGVFSKASSNNEPEARAPNSLGIVPQSSIVRVFFRPFHRKGKSHKYVDLVRKLDVDSGGMP